MKTVFALIAVLLILTSVVYAGPKELPKGLVQVMSGFLTGNDYRERSDDMKNGYAMGFVNGLHMAPALDAPRTKMRWVEECFVGMTSEQIVAILDKFLNENPARRHEPMNILYLCCVEGFV